jgi:glycosyltransferase involved in cell wall biosynthesis
MTTNFPPGLSIVIPVYNSAGSIGLVVEKLAEVLPTLTDHYEAVLVNDGSRDESWAAVEQLSRDYDWVLGVDLMRNFGQHNALLCGIRQAQYDVIVTMDDDLQHPPAEIAPLLAKLNEGYDVVYGTPQREQHGLLRDLASQVTKLVLQTAMGADIARNISAFRVFRTTLRNAFAEYNNPYVSIDVLLTWGTTRFSALPVRHEERTIGVSNYTFGKLVRHTFNMMTGFSTLPLQFASMMGFGLTVFGVLVLIYVLLNALINGSVVPGFAFTASIIAVFSGAQLLALGIIGEYLARMYARTLGRPSSVIRRTTHPEQDAS